MGGGYHTGGEYINRVVDPCLITHPSSPIVARFTLRWSLSSARRKLLPCQLCLHQLRPPQLCLHQLRPPQLRPPQICPHKRSRTPPTSFPSPPRKPGRMGFNSSSCFRSSQPFSIIRTRRRYRGFGRVSMTLGTRSGNCPYQPPTSSRSMARSRTPPWFSARKTIAYVSRTSTLEPSIAHIPR